MLPASVGSVTSGFWRAHGERAIYDSPWVWLGQVDVEPPGGDRYWHHVVRLRTAAVMAQTARKVLVRSRTARANATSG